MVLDVRASSQFRSLIEEFERTCDATRAEVLADELGDLGDPCAIRPLLARLGESLVQEDRDVEDSVCGALVSLSVMRVLGNLRFAFVDRSRLPDGVADMIRGLDSTIPLRYFASGGRT
jgi:hypothetical protein